MSDAKKCDICGEYYDYSPSSKDNRPKILIDGDYTKTHKYNIWSINFCGGNDTILTKKDLCPECACKIYEMFYKNDEEESNNES